jgi:hypothetical protein
VPFGTIDDGLFFIQLVIRRFVLYGEDTHEHCDDEKSGTAFDGLTEALSERAREFSALKRLRISKRYRSGTNATYWGIGETGEPVGDRSKATLIFIMIFDRWQSPVEALDLSPELAAGGEEFS